MTFALDPNSANRQLQQRLRRQQGVFATRVFWRQIIVLKSGPTIERNPPKQPFDNPDHCPKRHADNTIDTETVCRHARLRNEIVAGLRRAACPSEKQPALPAASLNQKTTKGGPDTQQPMNPQT